MSPKPFNQVTFTFVATDKGGYWRCTMKLAVHDVTLQDHMTTEVMEDQKRRFQLAEFPVEVICFIQEPK